MFISCHEKEAFPFIGPKTALAAFKGFSTSKKRVTKQAINYTGWLGMSVLPVLLPAAWWEAWSC